MPTIHFEANIFTLAFALSVAFFIGRAFLRFLPPLSIPQMRLPRMGFRISTPNLEAFQRVQTEKESASIVQRNRNPVTRLHYAEPPHEPAFAAESILEETMRSLEQAFTSFEEGRICAKTYRSLLLAERRAVGRHRVRLEIKAEDSCNEEAVSTDAGLTEANTAVEAVEWCLDWVENFERSRKAV